MKMTDEKMIPVDDNVNMSSKWDEETNVILELLNKVYSTEIVA